MVTVGWTLCVTIHFQEVHGFIMDIIVVTPLSAGKETGYFVTIMELMFTPATSTVIPKQISYVTTRPATCISRTPTITDSFLSQDGKRAWGSASAVDVSSFSAISTGTVDLTCYAMTIIKAGHGLHTLLLAATSRMPSSGT